MSRHFIRPRYEACLLLAFGWMLLQEGLAPVAVSAIQTESQAEKQANFKQQALGELFHRWTFDQQKPGDPLSGFSQFIVGGNAAPVWTVSAEADAPSPPNILKAESSCQTGTCYQLLVADHLYYEYPDVTVRLRFPAEGATGQGGIIIGLQDERHFYAAVVDLVAKTVEVIRVLDDQVTVLGESTITPKAVEWHYQQGRDRGVLRWPALTFRAGSDAGSWSSRSARPRRFSHEFRQLACSAAVFSASRLEPCRLLKRV